MPLTGAQLRAQLADTARNPRRQVAGLGEGVELTLNFVNKEIRPEEIYDALAGQFGTAAALSTALAGANNDLTFTARRAGGSDITIAYVVAGLNTALSVAVAGRAITVNVATDGAGAATSTAAQVRDAVNLSLAASALVFAANAAANDGTGVVTALAATALAGGDGKVSSDRDVAGQRVFEFDIAA